MAQSQSFNFSNFTDAKHRLSLELNGVKHFIEYDRITLWQYRTDLTRNVHAEIYSYAQTHLEEKLGNNSEQKKWLYEYWALHGFMRCTGVNYPNIDKTLHPDFVIHDSEGRRIGIEATELTVSLDMKRQNVFKEFSGQSYPEVVPRIEKRLGEDAIHFDIVPLGPSFTIMPKEATCLSTQRESNAEQLLKKYDKYNEIHNIIKDFDEFIILGDALRSKIAITEEYEAEEILSILRQNSFRSNTTFALIFRDYASNTILTREWPQRNRLSQAQRCSDQMG
ncbi:MAG: hypothetical protein PHP02_04655 [Eubacteriales bacterium]|nr:hypothetical protein [Eubacteriales bacterium]